MAKAEKKTKQDTEQEKKPSAVKKSSYSKKKKVKKIHSYEIPCIIFFDVKNGNNKFLKWIIKSV